MMMSHIENDRVTIRGNFWRSGVTLGDAVQIELYDATANAPSYFKIQCSSDSHYRYKYPVNTPEV